MYVSIVFVGLGNSNIFSIIFSQALLHKPSQKNEISGLMIMGLIGGAIFPLFMGLLFVCSTIRGYFDSMCRSGLFGICRDEDASII